MIINSNDEINFLHKFLLTDTKVSETRKAFQNSSLANKNFQKLNCLKWCSQEEFFVKVVGLPCAAIKAGTQELTKKAPELKYFVNKETNKIL